MNIQAALKGQYHAALAMLQQTLEKCPDDLWTGGAYPIPFWRVAYHTLYFAHLYLQQNEEAFRPWENHRNEYHDLPWPGDSEPKTLDPYTKPQILDYWRLCEAMVDTQVDRLDLEAPESGFSWHKTIPKFEHQIHNIRHIQHHAAILSSRLRQADGTEVRWVRSNKEMYKP
ncbi:MAG: DinB family protein [Planctomycetota bacterium]